MMRKKLFNIALIGITLFLGACKKDKDDAPAEWTTGSNFEGIPRSAAASFVIDNKVYVVSGYDGEKRLSDLWYYDAEKTNWFRVQGADIPGKARNYAVAFALNGKGYVGTGTDGGTEPLKDFYEFNPATNTWKQIADFPGDGRYGALAFTADGKGIVGSGTGVIGDFKDFYSYTPATNSWEQVKSLPGTKRTDAFTFTIGQTTYVGGGINNGLYLTDFWKYEGGEWTKLKDIQRDKKPDQYNLSRRWASTFVINQKGFIVGGNNGQVLNTTWRYDPVNDSWKSYQNFKGAAREAAISFSMSNKGYVVTGRNGSLRFDDMWVFSPNE